MDLLLLSFSYLNEANGDVIINKSCNIVLMNKDIRKQRKRIFMGKETGWSKFSSGNKIYSLPDDFYAAYRPYTSIQTK